MGDSLRNLPSEGLRMTSYDLLARTYSDIYRKVEVRKITYDYLGNKAMYKMFDLPSLNFAPS